MTSDLSARRSSIKACWLFRAWPFPKCSDPHQDLVNRLRAHGCEPLLYRPSDRSSAMAILADADISLATPSQRFVFDGEMIVAAHRLRAVNSVVIGTETIDVTACTEAGIVVGNGAVPENIHGVAEATVMLILALGLELKRKERALRLDGRRPGNSRSSLLLGRTVGLIGLGRIGREVVKRRRVDPRRVDLRNARPHRCEGNGVHEAAVENVSREARGELPLYAVNPNVEPRWRERLARIAAKPLEYRPGPGD